MKSILTGYNLILCMWATFIANLILPYDLNQWGVIPRELGGLPGILCWSFLHFDFAHIIGNSIALLILMPPIFAMHDKDHGFDVILGISILAGLVTWLIGTPAIHIGASGMVYGLATYGVVGGIKQKNILVIIYSVGVIMYMGTSLIFGMFPKEGVSWTGHIAGVVAGAITEQSLFLPEMGVDNGFQPNKRSISSGVWFNAD